MPYYQTPTERPRQAKRFLTAREIEDMVAEGRTEIVHLDDMVITDAARETAHDLGIRIVRPDVASPGGHALPAAAPASTPATPRPQVTIPRVDGPAANAPAVSAALPVPATTAVPEPRAASSDPYVQALVQAVRAAKG